MATPAAVRLVPVLAHQGGWDEALLVAVPLGLVAALVVLARRRVRRARQGDGDEPSTP